MLVREVEAIYLRSYVLFYLEGTYEPKRELLT